MNKQDNKDKIFLSILYVFKYRSLKTNIKTNKKKTNKQTIKTLRGRAVYAYVFKTVDGQGTQATIKNLNWEKSKRFWNQNFIEVNDYTV